MNKQCIILEHKIKHFINYTSKRIRRNSVLKLYSEIKIRPNVQQLYYCILSNIVFFKPITK